MTIIDSLQVPAISSQERSRRLAEAATEWTDRIVADPSSAELTYRVRGESIGSVATSITAGKHEFLIDEPGALAGDDLAASPVEFALAALISCQVVVYRLYANSLGIQLDDIKVVAEGDLDARRLFGISEDVRAGFSAVRLEIRLIGPESVETYRSLQSTVDAHCPVLDLFANEVPVTVSVARG